MIMMIIASLVILCLILIVAYGRLKNRQEKDSALKQRAVLNANQQLTLLRLREVVPQAQVLAQVSFDALLTTKYLHTRRKYQDMVADFVLLDREFRVMAVIRLDDLNLIKRSKKSAYQDAILKTVGYRTIRYVGVPTHEKLREDFCIDLPFEQNDELCTEQILQHAQYYDERIAKMRAIGS